MKNKWTFKVLSNGKTSYGPWALGYLSDDVILYYGIVQVSGDVELVNDVVYDVKTIDVKQNKNNKLIIKIGL